MEEEEKRSLLLMETAQQTRQMRHDLRHHLRLIQAMAGDENPNLTAYISELIRDIPNAVRDYCENPTVNTVVSHYAARCQQEGIAFTARLTVPAQNENLDDRALCVVFANLLENGVEACGRHGRGEKFIRLNSSLEYGVLTITMDNSFDGQAQQEDGKFLSSKRVGAPGVASAPSGPWQRPIRGTPGLRQTGGCSARRHICACDRRGLCARQDRDMEQPPAPPCERPSPAGYTRPRSTHGHTMQPLTPPGSCTRR